jgi:hypothetical protein
MRALALDNPRGCGSAPNPGDGAAHFGALFVALCGVSDGFPIRCFEGPPPFACPVLVHDELGWPESDSAHGRYGSSCQDWGGTLSNVPREELAATRDAVDAYTGTGYPPRPARIDKASRRRHAARPEVAGPSVKKLVPKLVPRR